MFKFLILFFNIIANNFFSNPDDIEMLITPKDVLEEKELIDVNEGYEVYKGNDEYIIKSENVTINIKHYNNLIEFEEKIYVSYWINEKIFIDVYDLNGALLEKINYLKFNALELHKLIAFNDKLYLIATSFNEKGLAREDLLFKNIMLYDVLSKEMIAFGGVLNEELLDVYVNDGIYMCILKDKVSYGDFGNGGDRDNNILKAKIKEEIKIVNYNVLNVEFSKDVQIKVLNKIYLKIDNNIYLCDFNFEVINNMTYEGLSYIGENFIVIFCENTIYLYDLNSFIKLYEIESSFSALSIYYIGNQIFINDGILYSFDIIDFRLVRNEKKLYYESFDEDRVYTLYGKATLIEKEYTEYFDKNVFGNYDYDISYKNYYQTAFILHDNYNIKLETNVIEGMNYPLGYRLLFNGEALLDGKTIVNNYPVNDVGVHNIIIYGSGCEKRISFEISQSRDDYSDVIFDEYDANIIINNDFTISITLNNMNDITITNIISNWEVTSFNQDNNKLDILFKGKEDIGKYILYIERALYNYEGLEYELLINKYYEIIFCFPPLEINVGKVDENFKMQIEYIGLLENIRGVEVIFENATRYYEKRCLINNYNCVIDTHDIPSDNYDVYIYILSYNITGYVLNEVVVMNVTLNDKNYEFMKIDDYRDEECGFLNFKINDDVVSNIKYINYDSNKIYEGEKNDTVFFIILAIVFGIGGMLAGVFIRRKYFFKTQ